MVGFTITTDLRNQWFPVGTSPGSRPGLTQSLARLYPALSNLGGRVTVDLVEGIPPNNLNAHSGGGLYTEVLSRMGITFSCFSKRGRRLHNYSGSGVGWMLPRPRRFRDYLTNP